MELQMKIVILNIHLDSYCGITMLIFYGFVLESLFLQNDCKASKILQSVKLNALV